MSIPPNQFRRDHPWTRFVLLDSSAGPVPSQAKETNFFLRITLSLKKNLFLLLATGRALLMSSKGRNASGFLLLCQLGERFRSVIHNF